MTLVFNILKSKIITFRLDLIYESSALNEPLKETGSN